jgi:DnaJ-class molecular chaperone
MSERLVNCFRCKGTGKSPDLPMPCACCKGTGKLTKKLFDAKRQIAKDIAAKLLGQR